MSSEYRLATVIGRFEPNHIGHISTIREAFNLAPHVLIIIGSANQPRTIKNPFTAQEREDMIRGALTEQENRFLHVAHLRDYMYQELEWIKAVQAAVYSHVSSNDSVVLVGHHKDDTSYYLESFRQWSVIDVGMTQQIDATQIRQLMFENKFSYLDAVLPPNVRQFLEIFRTTSEFATLVEEYEYIKAYKDKWKAAPFPPTFVTVDAVVIQSGNVLMVERGFSPGKGLLALPGGFLNQDETTFAGAMRELYEETKIKIQKEILERACTYDHIFDHPKRSLRGRTLTHAYLFELTGGTTMPKVKAADDAKKAMWIPIQTIAQMSDQIFEDHLNIIEHMTGRAKK